MTRLFDSLFEELKSFWKKPHAPRSKRAFRCDCGRPVFFATASAWVVELRWVTSRCWAS